MNKVNVKLTKMVLAHLQALNLTPFAFIPRPGAHACIGVRCDDILECGAVLDNRLTTYAIERTFDDAAKTSAVLYWPTTKL